MRYLIAFLGFATVLTATPRVYLWAWDRPEDLRFLDHEITVAYFAGEIDLRAKRPAFHPRQKPLLLQPGHPVLPVLHVRAGRGQAYRKAEAQLILDAVQMIRERSKVTQLQLDFEVFHSQRDFLAESIDKIRKANPGIALSITALSSWCADAAWLQKLNADEIVPMYFDPSHRRGRRHVFAAADSRCAGAAGVATYESYPDFPKAQRYYLFHNRAWQSDAITRMLKAIHEVHR